MKFSFKDFDYKAFLIQYGERIGLWAAVGITALILVFVVMDLFAGRSASQNAKLITDLSASKQQAIQSSRPTEDVDKVPTDIKEGATPQAVDAALYAANNFLFDPNAQEDKKWRLPTVLPPDDFIVRYVQAQVPSFIFKTGQSGDDIQVAVLHTGADSKKILQDIKEKREKAQRDKMTRRQRQIYDFLQSRGGMGGMPGMPGGAGGMRPGFGGPGGPGGGPGMPGGGPPGGGGMGRMGMMGMMGGGNMMNMMQGMGSAYGMGGGGTGATEYKFNWVSYDKAEQESDWARTMLPVRMVIVTGAFPLKQEMETFRQALRFSEVSKMLEEADFEFAGLTVERREAKTAEDLQKAEWKPLDVEANFKAIMIRAAGKEPDDQKLEQSGIIYDKANNRLVMPLPKLEDELHKDNKYPDDLPESIKAAVEAYEKGSKPAAMAQKKKSRFDIKSYSFWGEEGDQGQMAPAPGPETPPREGVLSNEPAGPDKCLVRFIDVAVRPGMIYEYRMKVRMFNPTYKKTDKAVTKFITETEQIEGNDWAVIPEKVKVPDELLFFAVDEKRSTEGTVVQPERVPVQVQHWLDLAQTDPKNKSSEVPVGEWSILEKIWAHRGEYIGETKEVEVPIWVTTMKKFLFAMHADDTPLRKPGAAPPRRIKHKGIPVDFNTGVLLVDFAGGKRYYPVGASKVLDEGPVELLVLSPDGKKLLVRNGRVDADNPERKKHVEEWKSVQEKVKEEVDSLKGGGKGDPLQKFTGGGRRGGP
jgi:hypothetical protein